VVDEGGVIRDAAWTEPTLNNDIFDLLNLKGIKDPSTLEAEVEFYPALVQHFQSLAERERQIIIDRIAGLILPTPQSVAVWRLLPRPLLPRTIIHKYEPHLPRADISSADNV
jgi:hypothetical protein